MRRPMVLLVSGLAAAIALVGMPLLEAQTGTTITVDVLAQRKAIDPRIYGLAFASQQDLATLHVPLNRSGGNATTSHNWQVNATNRANDWYYESLDDGSATPAASDDDFVSSTRTGGAAPMVTIPTIGWVAKLGTNRARLSSYSQAKYGVQQGSDSQWFPDAGNGVLASTGQPIVTNDPNDANVGVDSTFEQGLVQHLVGKFGAASAGGVRFYILDNEPSLWFSTHRDVHNVGPTMDEIKAYFLDYGAKIKAADPAALIVGPEEWGWSGYFYSGFDQQYGGQHGWSTLPDRNNHAGADYLPWLLDQLHANQVSTGQRLLDVFTVHYYPQGGEFGNDVSSAMQLRRNRSTRSLWDPNYVDETWINDKVQLIPRLKAWVAAHYPGTPIGITEYNWGAEGHINGATTQADVFGIFGREGLDLAARWTTPAAGTPTYNAIKMYRNYDDNGGGFGDTSVSASGPNPDQTSVFAAQRASDGALTIMAVSKVLTGTTPATINLANFTSAGTAQVWRLDSSNAIQHLADVAVSSNALSVSLPPQSITLFVLPAATAPTLSVSDASVTEGNSGTVNANFTVTLSAVSASTVTVAYATADGTAVAPGDYVSTSGTLTFAPGDTTKTVAVPVNGDTAVEADETFTLGLSAPVNATIADGQGTGTILNDDTTPVTISIGDVTVTEGNSGTTNAVFAVTLSGTSTQPVTVDYTTANGTATAGSDYSAKSGNLSFTAGTTSQTITVAVTGDTAVEPSETFVVNLSNAVGATIARAQGTGTIINDDAAAGAAPSTYYVTATGLDTNPCSFASPCREIRKPLTLVTAGATILVGDGSYMGFDVNGLHGTASAPITIKALGTGAQVTKTTDRSDNRDTIFITGSSFIIIDGLRSSGANRAAVRVDSSPNVTIRNGVFGNNATWGIFTDFSDDLLIERNECFGSGTQHGIYVSNSGDRPVLRDNRSHDNAGGGLQLNADASQGGDGIITGALLERNVIYNNGTSGGAGINLDGVQSSIVRNNVLYNNHATGIANFQIDGAAGPQGMQIIHNTIDMASDGRWALLITSASGSNVVRNNILYNRNPNRGGISFGSSADVTSTDSDYNVLDRATPDDSTVFTLAQWQAQGHEMHSFSATPASLWVNDAAADYHLAAGSPAIDKGPALANATGDIDTNPRPWGSASDLGADEAVAASLTTTAFVSGLSNATSMHLAPDGRIFISQQTGELKVFKNGSLLATPFVSLTVDSSGERGLLGAAFDPNFTANHFIYVYYTVPGSPAHNRVSRFTANGDVAATGSELPILDLDLLSTATNHNGGALHFGPDGRLFVAVGENANGSNSQSFTTDLGKILRINTDGSIPTDNPYFATTTGNNRAIWALGLRNPYTFDFQAGTGRLFINDVGQSTFEEIDDGIVGSNYGWPTTEGPTSNPTFRGPIYSYQHSTGTPTGCAITGGAFYNPPAATFPANHVGKYFFADFCGGWIYLFDPALGTATQFTTGISSPVDIAVGSDGALYYLARGDGKIYRVQNTPPPTLPTLSINDVSVTEGNSGTVNATFTVALSATSATAVTVNYATADGTATVAGSDYVAKNGTLTFAAGTTTQTIAVAVNGDTVVEPNETFVVNLSAPSGATIADGQGVGTIVNDDVAPLPTLSINDVSVTEGNAGTVAATFTVTLSATSATPVTVNYATADGTATVAGSDYVAKSGTLTFAAGTTTQTIAVTVNGDTAVEPNETFVVNLTSPSGATIADSQGVGTIPNDDSTPPTTTPVVWTSMVGVSANGNSLTKTAATGWNAGAASSQALASGDGYVEITASETNTYRLLGLSNGDTDQNYTDIDFAIYPAVGGSLLVYEKGTSRGSFGSYATGDKLQVAVESGMVKYKKNGTTFYTSTAAPTYPLLVDAALYTAGATLNSAVLSGAWSASTPPPPPTTTPVVWTSMVGVSANGNSLTKTAATGWNAGAASSQALASGDGYVEITASETNTYRLLGLSNGDTDQNYTDIDFAIYPAVGGSLLVYEKGTSRGSFGSYATGDKLQVAVESGMVKYKKNGTTFYTSTAAPTYPLLVDAALYTAGATLNSAVLSGAWSASTPPPPPTTTPVVWTSMVGVSANGNSLTKTAATGWNAGAASSQALASGDGYVEITASETNTYRLLGLSNGDTDQNYTDIDFAIYPAVGGSLLVYEKGASRGTFGTYATGDKLQVSVESGVVKYKKNGSVFYTSTVAPTYPLLVDTSLYTAAATINSAVLTGTWQ